MKLDNDKLRELEKEGVIEVKQSRNGRQIEFTEPGEAFTEMQIAWNEDMQLFLFDLYWNEKYGDVADPYRKIIKIAKDMKENPGINILRTIEANQDKLGGIELKDGYLPEDFVQQFDPESNSTPGADEGENQ